MATEVTEAAAPERTRWEAVQVLVDRNLHDLAARRYGLSHEVVSWFKSLALFRELEDEYLIARKPTPTSKRCHRSLLAMLIAEGERLLHELDRSGGLPRNSRISQADVEATVEELQDTQRGLYGAMSDARRRQVLEELTGAEARSTR